jgi:glycosyltransferase involved in cell wall biosynthesis
VTGAKGRLADWSVGLVHDYLLVMRGAERTFQAIASCWPDAPVYTALYSEQGTRGAFAGRRVITSPLQRLPVSQRGFRRLLPFYPGAVERLPIGDHDLIVSSSSAFAHGVRPSAGALHVCYCHAPFRYAWHERDRALDEVPRVLRPLLSRQLDRMRRWDVAAAGHVTAYIANSELTRRRIEEIYGRQARVLHPPVDVARFRVGEPEDFLLVVTELVRHKRVDVALEAARLAGAPIQVVGTGPELPALRSRYGDAARFRGRVSDEELAELYSRCLAVVVPNVEEFGIVAVEAQASGRPVVALDRGGARETVIDGQTGVLVSGGEPGDFAEAIRDTDLAAFRPDAARSNAESFSVERFRAGFVTEVERGLAASAWR